MKIELIAAILSVCSLGQLSAQTYFTNLNSLDEVIDFQKQNIENPYFHSSFSPYRHIGPDSTDFVIRKGNFGFTPETEISAGLFDNDFTYNLRGGLSCQYHIGNKFSVYAAWEGGCSIFPEYFSSLADSLIIVPGEGNFKKFSDNNYATQYAEFSINYVPGNYLGFSLGKGKKFIGEGIRSLIMSASNSGMYYFDIDVNVKRFKYLFTASYCKSFDSESLCNKTKFILHHYIDINIGKRFSIGGFEAVCISRRDSSGNSNLPDASYFNPILFFRPVEYSLGSPDNILMGIFFNVRFYKDNKIYFQGVIDEFSSDFLKQHNGWWACKYAIQFGMKGTVPLTENLYYTAEYNYIRPYIYSHDNACRSYSAYSQPLAHPSGANLKEILLRCLYRKNNFSFEIYIDYINYGKDYNKISYGNNILRSYNNRADDFNNYTCQGLKSNLLYACIKPSFHPFNIKQAEIYVQAGMRKSNENQLFIMAGCKTGRLYFDRKR